MANISRAPGGTKINPNVRQMLCGGTMYPTIVSLQRRATLLATMLRRKPDEVRWANQVGSLVYQVRTGLKRIGWAEVGRWKWEPKVGGKTIAIDKIEGKKDKAEMEALKMKINKQIISLSSVKFFPN